MKPRKLNRQKLRRAVFALVAVLLALAVLVLVPLLTHRTPEPDPKYTERRPVPVQTPEPTPDIAPTPSPIPAASDCDEELQAILDSFTAEHEGRWDIYVYDLSRGKSAAVGPEDGQPMVSGGMIHLFIMGAVFQQFQEGSLVYWQNYSYICKMILFNDSYYTNYLIGALGEGISEAAFDYVNIFARSFGCRDTALNHTMLAVGLEENTTGAEDCALFFRKLYRHELVSPEYSADMLVILQAQGAGGAIQAGLPTGVACTHKAASQEGVCQADAGLVFSPGADYILSVIYNGEADGADVRAAITELSALVYEHFNPPVDETPEPVLFEP